MRPKITPAIAATNLVKEFRRPGQAPLRAVDGLSLTVQPGEIVAFLGPNGAGKTTTIDILLGLAESTSGTAAVMGLSPRDAVQTGKVSAVLQTGGLLADLTVSETVRLIASTFPHARPVVEVMERAGITSLASRRVSKCSGGEQQRLRFALALLPDPQVLILDEPTSGMDVRARQEFWDTMRADTASGRTVLFATHYLEEADAFAERIVLMANGKIAADGSTSEIRATGTGRVVSAMVPDTDRDTWLSRARALPGVSDVDIRGDRAYFVASDTDAVALAVLRDLGGRQLEVAPPSLDSAFLALTGTSVATDAPERIA